MGKRFQHFFANNSQYVMIFLILQQHGGMLVVLGGLVLVLDILLAKAAVDSRVAVVSHI